MATFKGGKELLMTCPYNPDHRVAPRRFDIHLIKCAQKSTIKLEICPFSSSHRIPSELMAAHIVECNFASNDILEMVQREKTEWEMLDEKKVTNKKVSEVAELAGRMGAIGLGQQDPPQAEKVEEKEPEILDPSWNLERTPSGYTVPGLEHSKKYVQTAYGGNAFRYQLMTPAERRNFNDKLVNRTKTRAEKISEAEAEKRQQEMKEKREKEKKEEQEKLEKEKQEREKIKKEKEAKKKAAKEKEKARKRAAFFAKQAQENENQVTNDEE